MRGRMLAPTVLACFGLSVAWPGPTTQPMAAAGPTLLPVVSTQPSRRPVHVTPVPVLPLHAVPAPVAPAPVAPVPVLPVHAAPVPVAPAPVAVAPVPVVAAPPMQVADTVQTAAVTPGARLDLPALPAPTPEQVRELGARWNGLVSVSHEERYVEIVSGFMALRPTAADMNVLFGHGPHDAILQRLEDIFNAELVHQLRKTIVRRMYTQADVRPLPDYRFRGARLAVDVPLFSVVLSRQDAPVRALQTRVRTFVFVNGHWVLIGR